VPRRPRHSRLRKCDDPEAETKTKKSEERNNAKTVERGKQVSDRKEKRKKGICERRQTQREEEVRELAEKFQ